MIITPVMLLKDPGNLCQRSYPGHPKGCPNYNKKDGCPPTVSLHKVLDMSKPINIIYNRFDLGSYVERMRERHPNWSWRQLVCCLYWQGTARKQLEDKIIEEFGEPCPDGSGEITIPFIIIRCPEAYGVNVTATMREIGINLEWPPKKWVYQVALVGDIINCDI